MSNNAHLIKTATVRLDATTNPGIKAAIADLVAFREARGWNEAGALVNLAKKLTVEANEVGQIFQWQAGSTTLPDTATGHLNEELADVMIMAFFMCEKAGVAPLKIIRAQLANNQNQPR